MVIILPPPPKKKMCRSPPPPPPAKCPFSGLATMLSETFCQDCGSVVEVWCCWVFVVRWQSMLWDRVGLNVVGWGLGQVVGHVIHSTNPYPSSPFRLSPESASRGIPLQSYTPRSDGSPVCRGQFGEVLIFYDRPSTRSSNAPACRGQSRLSGFCCAHRLCVRSPCQHISRMRTFDENSCAISITSPKVDFSSPEPNMFGGDAGTSPGERPHDVIAGESPARRDFPR